MSNSNINMAIRRFSPQSSLAAIGTKVRSLKLFDTIGKKMKIAQKTVKHTSIDKLYDAFINILSGTQGVVEINSRLRTDKAVQKAFGRKACAEQSVVQQTLDACSAINGNVAASRGNLIFGL